MPGGTCLGGRTDLGSHPAPERRGWARLGLPQAAAAFRLPGLCSLCRPHPLGPGVDLEPVGVACLRAGFWNLHVRILVTFGKLSWTAAREKGKKCNFSKSAFPRRAGYWANVQMPLGETCPLTTCPVG